MRTTTRSNLNVSILPSLAGSLSLLVLALLIQTGTAQDEAYQAYPLRHQTAATVKPQLSALIEHLSPAPHVLLDEQGNQILLRGSPQAHELTRQFLQSIDRPPVEVAEAQAVVRGYRIDPGELRSVAAGLESRFQNDPRLRLTVDPATSQIIVLAPAELQASVAAELARPAAAAAGPVASAPAAPAGNAARGIRADVAPARLQPPAGPAEQYLPLTQLAVAAAEQQLRQLLGGRLQAGSGGSAAGSTWIFIKDRRRVELLLDARQNGIRLVGDHVLVVQLSRLIEALDRSASASGGAAGKTRILPVRGADPGKIQEAVEAYRGGSAVPELDRQGRTDPTRSGVQRTSIHNGRLRLPVMLAQHTELVAAAEPPAAAAPPEAAEPAEQQPLLGQEVLAAEDAAVEGTEAGEEAAQRRLRQLGENVEIETLPDLDVIILRGRDPDVDEVARIIEEIERLSAETVPQIDVYRLRHVHCNAIVAIIELVAEDLIGGRQGKIHLTPLVKPNALLLIGWGEAITAMKELIAQLDQPVAAETQLRVYHLKSASAATAAATVEDTFADPEGMAPRVQVIPDLRTNSLIIRAAPRDVAEVDLLISRIDQGSSAYVSQARLFKLKNTLAMDLAATLQEAISAAAGAPGDEKSAVLELLTADVRGQKLLRSGVLTDAQITPDPHTNTLVVTAPAESMELLEALIKQLDSPSAVAQIKVFKIINGDASSLVEMLRSLLPAEMTVAGPQLAGAEGESTLVPVRFSVDVRTNSIIATGSEGDLAIVEALLLRLDQQDVEQRINSVYRLKNAPALEVAEAVNEFLRSERLVQQATPGLMSPFEQIESEVVVVPEPVSNSLIISATPRFFEDIVDVVEKLDEQPAQVMIQVVIVDVELDNFDEFGVELGIQDSVLFDRSLLGNLEKVVTKTITQTPGGATETVQEETIVAATNTPGFDFNNNPLGNAGSDRAFASSNQIGTQGLTHFELGRINSELGYGGLVLSASSESVSLLVRALQQSRRMEVLGRPQIMTLDNQPAFIQVGERVPRIIGSRFDGRVQTNEIELENTGIILGVTPRISPEGMVVMEIDAEKSEVGPEADGIPVSVVESQVIKSPKIAVTSAQTTVSANSGETIVLGGLITKRTDNLRRRVPWLSDIPLLGQLFRYDSERCTRSELLIFLTPRVVRNSEDVERLKLAEAARMHWCLSDVHEIHGPTGLYEDVDGGCWTGDGEIIFPDMNPEGQRPGDFGPEKVPMEKLELWPPIEQLPSPAEQLPTPAEQLPTPAGEPDILGASPAVYQPHSADGRPYPVQHSDYAPQAISPPGPGLPPQYGPPAALPPTGGAQTPPGGPLPQQPPWAGP